MWDLSSPTRDQTLCHPASEVWSLNHWTTREVPKIDFTRMLQRDKGYYIIIKVSIQKDITIVNIYAPNIGAPHYIRQMLTAIKGEIDSNTIIWC